MEPEPVAEPEPQDNLPKLNYITNKLETIIEIIDVDVKEFKKNVQIKRKRHRHADYFLKNTTRQAQTILERAMSNFAQLANDIREYELELDSQSSCLSSAEEDQDPDDPTNSNGLLITTTATTATTPNDTNKVTFVQEKNTNVVDLDRTINISKEEFIEYPFLNENDMEVVDDEIPSCSKSFGDKDQDKSDVFKILGLETSNMNMLMSPTTTTSANPIDQNQSQVKKVKDSVNSTLERKPAATATTNAIHRQKKLKLKPPPPPLITRPLVKLQQQQLANTVKNYINLSFDEKRNEIINQFSRDYRPPRPRSPNCEPSGPTMIHRKKLKPPPLSFRSKVE